MQYCYEILNLKHPTKLASVGESFTFVSYETLNNIFPSVEIELDISDQKVTLREKSYEETLKNSLNAKLEEHSEIWKELAKY
jgi:hypothetical protein